VKNFKDFNLSEPVSRAIAELGYETPSQIQAEALPLLLGADTDFLGLAATGTGKTAAFGIPLLERLENTRGVQALILCPTRELAIQVAGQIDLLGKYKGVKTVPIYGGTGYAEQLAGLRSGANVVVGTPGRVVDHINKGYLNLSKLKTLVLDEADEMISMGFQEDLETVLKAAPKDQSNIWLFSATMGSEVRHVADAYLKNPQKVQVNKTDMVPTTVEQFFFKVHEYDKPDVLCKLIDAADEFYGIIFCQTKALVVDVNSLLNGKGYRADCLHGDMDQTGRDRVMKSFRDRNVSILVATDVACRGLDVKDLTHIVNYSIPRELDNYVHRIGRTGRNGKAGMAFSLVTFSHRELIGRIERMTKSKMQEGHVPTPKEIALKRVAKVRGAFEARGPQGRIQTLMDDTWAPLLEAMTKEEITGRFLGMLCADLATTPAPAAKPKTEKKSKAKVEESSSEVPTETVESVEIVAANMGGHVDSDESEDLDVDSDEIEEVRAPREERAPRAPGGFRKDFKKDFKPRGDRPAYGAKRSFGDKPAYGSKPAYGAKRSYDDKPAYGSKPAYGAKRSFGDKPAYGEKRSFGPKPYGEKTFDARSASAPSFEKKPFNKFASKKPSESRTPPWERKPARSESHSAGPSAGPSASPAASGPGDKSPRWKSPGTAKLGGKPRWKIVPKSE